jgi:hypothetical protein
METGVRPVGSLPAPQNARESLIRHSDLILLRIGGPNTAGMLPMPDSATRPWAEASLIAGLASNRRVRPAGRTNKKPATQLGRGL